MLLAFAALFLQDAPPPAPLPPTWLERFQLGWEAYERGELDQAERAWLECREFAPENATTAYHLACLEARRGRVEPAYEWLARSAEWGYADAAVAGWDEELKPLREDARFERALARMSDNAAIQAQRSVPSSACRWDWGSPGMMQAINRDGTRMLCGRGADGVLLDLEHGEPLALLGAHQGKFALAGFSPDGTRVVSTGHDKTIHLWDGETGAHLRALDEIESWGGRVCFAAQGSAVLVSGAIATESVAVWDVADGKLRVRRSMQADAFAVLSPDGERAFTLRHLRPGGARGTLWSTRDGQDVATIDLPGRENLHDQYLGGWSPDGERILLLASAAQALRVLDARDLKLVREAPLASGWPLLTCWTASGHELARWKETGELSIEEADSGQVLRTIPLPPGKANGLALSADGRHAALASDDGTRLVDLERGESRAFWPRPAGGLPVFASGRFSGDGSRYLAPSGWVGWELREVATSAVVARSSGLEADAEVLDVSSDRRRLALRVGRALRVLAADSGRTEVELLVEEDSRAQLAPDGESIAVVSPDGRVALLELASGRTLVAFACAATSGEVLPERCELSFAPHGRTLLSHGPRRSPELWRAEDGRRLATLGGGLPSWRAPAWSPDGKLLALAEGERGVRLYDAASGKPLGEPLAQPGDVECLAFSPDGKWLAAGTRDARAHVWDVATRTERFELSHEDQNLSGDLEVGWVEFSPDGRSILTSTRDFGEVASWDATNGARRWAFDFGGGNPATLFAHFDASGERVLTSGQTAWTGRVSDARTGDRLCDLRERGVSRLWPLAEGAIALVGREGLARVGADLRTRWRRVDVDEGTLRASPSGVWEGPAEAARAVQLVREGIGSPLDGFAALLADPKRVEASVAGVEVLAVALPAAPRLRLASSAARRIEARRVEVGIESDGPPLGVRVEDERGARVERLAAGAQTLLIEISPPEGRRASRLTLRALDARGLMGRPVHLVVEVPAGEGR